MARTGNAVHCNFEASGDLDVGVTPPVRDVMLASEMRRIVALLGLLRFKGQLFLEGRFGSSRWDMRLFFSLSCGAMPCLLCNLFLFPG